jgi:hypothetical protein
MKNYIFRPISCHPQVQNLCLKHIEEEYTLSYSFLNMFQTQSVA